MGIWSWVAGIVAGAAIIFLLASGSDDRTFDRTFAGREREAFYERSAQSVYAMPVSAGPEQAMTIVISTGDVPQDVAPSLDEVRQLLATAATQPSDQAKATLEQAQEKLGAAITSIEKEADDTSNDATRIRLLRLSLTLKKIEALIQVKLDRM